MKEFVVPENSSSHPSNAWSAPCGKPFWESSINQCPVDIRNLIRKRLTSNLTEIRDSVWRKQVGNGCRLARESKGFTQLQLADRFGTSNHIISRLERGEGIKDFWGVFYAYEREFSFGSDDLYALDEASVRRAIFEYAMSLMAAERFRIIDRAQTRPKVQFGPTHIEVITLFLDTFDPGANDITEWRLWEAWLKNQAGSANELFKHRGWDCNILRAKPIRCSSAPDFLVWAGDWKAVLLMLPVDFFRVKIPDGGEFIQHLSSPVIEKGTPESDHQNVAIQAASRIVGRDKLVETIRRKLLNCPSQTILIHGEPGIGKTGVMERYVEMHPICFSYFIRSSKDDTLETCLRDLCLQIIDKYHLPFGPMPHDLNGIQNTFRSLLRRVSESIRVSGSDHIEIVIDGLDELPRQSFNNPLAIPDTPLPGVFCLLSARHPGVLLYVPSSLLEINQETEGHRDAIRDYIERQCVPSDVMATASTVPGDRASDIVKRHERLIAAERNLEDFAKELGSKTQWNFMYVRCVLLELSQSRDIIELHSFITNLPPELKHYYRLHWERIWRCRDRGDKRLLKALFVLCFCEVPTWRASWVRTFAELSVAEAHSLVEEEWAMFLRRTADPSGHWLYTFYNYSYLEFLQKDPIVEGTYVMSGLPFSDLHLEVTMKLPQYYVAEYLKNP